MFVTNKRNISPPKDFIIENFVVEVVDSFKLLEVTVDNKMTFSKHVSDIKLSVNKRLFSIKRLFYLSYNVKLQFFKTFSMPFYDYCLSLIIYFPKRTIQKLANSYNFCLAKLLNLRANIIAADDFNCFNNQLSSLNIKAFQHRILNKLSIFSHNIVNQSNSPLELKC